MMLLTRSRSTALPLRSSGSRYWPSPGLAVGDRLERAAAARRAGGPRLGRLALDELLADQRLRADQAATRPRGSPGTPGRRSAGRRRPCPGRGSPSSCAGSSAPVTSTSETDADLGAGDADLLALDQEAGVVEDRPHLVGALVAAGRRAERRGPRPRRRSRRAMTAIRLMAPGARRRGHSRRRATPTPRNGWSVGVGQPAFAWVAAARAAGERAEPERRELVELLGGRRSASRVPPVVRSRTGSPPRAARARSGRWRRSSR